MAGWGGGADWAAGADDVVSPTVHPATSAALETRRIPSGREEHQAFITATISSAASLVADKHPRPLCVDLPELARPGRRVL